MKLTDRTLDRRQDLTMYNFCQMEGVEVPLEQGFPTFLLPCTPSAFQQISTYLFSISIDAHVPLRFPITIHFIMIIR